MPIYEYRCLNCGKRFEVLQKFSDAPLSTHDECGSGPVERLLSPPALQFKGSGWYVNDYARAGANGEPGASKPDAAKAESKSGESKSGETKGSESKGGDTKSSDSKGQTKSSAASDSGASSGGSSTSASSGSSSEK